MTSHGQGAEGYRTGPQNAQGLTGWKVGAGSTAATGRWKTPVCRFGFLPAVSTASTLPAAPAATFGCAPAFPAHCLEGFELFGGEDFRQGSAVFGTAFPAL